MTVVVTAGSEIGGSDMLRNLEPTKRITVWRTPCAGGLDTLAVISEAICEEVGCVRAKRVGGRIVADVPTILPSVVIERRLADAGIDAEVDTIVRFV
jgi:hypothetical protein